MSTWAVTMVRDEADVIEGTLRHMADEVDGIVVADNGSRDGTRQILARLQDELGLVVLDDNDPAYYQSQKMSRLAAVAGDMGATWVVPFDADELWLAHYRLADSLKRLGDGPNVVRADLYNHFCTALDDKDDDPFRRMTWRQIEPGKLPKVAFRFEPQAVVHQGNHGVSLPSGERVADRTFQVRHFPYRSADQMIRKARNGAEAYAATNLPETFGAHWRQYGDLIARHGEQAMRDVFETYFFHLSPIDAGMIHDPAEYLRWRR